MTLDPLFDIRDAVKTGSEIPHDTATSYLKRLLAVIDAIESACTISEDHAGGWGDSAAVYTEHIRQDIQYYGAP